MVLPTMVTMDTHMPTITDTTMARGPLMPSPLPAEPTADADAYYGYYGHPLAYTHHGYGYAHHGYYGYAHPYAHHGYYGKRSADAEPAADAGYLYGHYGYGHRYGYAHHGYYGYPYAHHGYYGYGK